MPEKLDKFSQETLLEKFKYKDGILYWKTKRRFGKIAGSVSKRGYCTLFIGNNIYSAHRIIFKMFHGYVPKIVDHIDGNASNNRIENLRSSNSKSNAWNSRGQLNVTSAYKGVHKESDRSCWRAAIMKNGKLYRIGRFKTELSAAKAYDKYASKLHGTYAKLNFPGENYG